LLHLADPALAIGLLTRLPVSVDMETTKKRGAAAAWAFPLAGLVVGGIAALVQALMLWMGLSPAMATAIALGVMILLTGAMHEDGLADCADGFWGAWERDRRLEIMHDSRIGAYGVLAIALFVILRWQGLTEIVFSPLMLPALAMLSRAAMVALWTALPPARPDGLARSIGRPSPRTAVLAILLGLAGAFVLIGPSALLAAAAMLAGTAVTGAVALRKIGGQTGDVLGASQQTSEVAMLLFMSALLT
jgi:adenosylcobinamide-GDP ribazoletransferase